MSGSFFVLFLYKIYLPKKLDWNFRMVGWVVPENLLMGIPLSVLV